jgi:hypothetical protein
MPIIRRVLAPRPTPKQRLTAGLLTGALLGIATAFAGPKPVVISGHLDHPLAPQVQVTYQVNSLTREPANVLTAKLDAHGNFRLVVPGLKGPLEAIFHNGDQQTTLFLIPGDNLRLTLDGAKFDESLRYTGAGAAANNYLAQAATRFGISRPDHPVRKIEAATPAQMVALTDAYRQEQRTAFQAYVAKYPVPAIFRAYVRQNADFDRAGYLLYYGGYHTQRPELNTGAIPTNFYEFLPPLRPAQDSALAMGSRSYLDFVTSLSDFSQAGLASEPTEEALLASAQAAFGNGRSRDLALAHYVYRRLVFQPIEQVKPQLAIFRRLNRDSLLARTLRARYLGALAILPGQPAPAFTLLDNTGKKVSAVPDRNTSQPRA